MNDQEVNKCPANGIFGVDVDEKEIKETCDHCNLWKACALQNEINAGHIPASTVLPDKPPEQPKFEYIEPPEVKKGRQCHRRNPLNYDCKNCPKLPDCRPYLKWHSMTPHFIIEDLLKTLSGDAFKIFALLNKTVDYRPQSNHFGRCWLTYDQIREATGMKPKSHVERYVKELVAHNLIELRQTLKLGPDKNSTINQFTVTWYKKMSELGAYPTH